MAMTDDRPGRPDSPGDRVVRAITDDDNFRVITATTSGVVRQAMAAQQLTGVTARHFADLLTGTVLVRETMSPSYRVQGLLKGAGGRGTLVADAHPDGSTRGLAQLPSGVGAVTIGEGSLLQMMRLLASGKPFKGLVRPPPGADVSAALMTYLQESEQIVSVIATGWDGQLAGGYVVQLLPDAQRGPLETMTCRLEALAPIEQLLQQVGGSSRRLLDVLLDGIPYAQLDESPLRYECKCDLEAVVATLATLSGPDLAELLQEQEVIELSCDYCKATYRVGRAQLQGLLQSS